MPYANTKTYENTGTYQFTKVGRHILVWTRGGEAPVPGTRNVIISAHGGQSVVNSTFKVPDNTSVYFYCPHGYTLLDPMMIRIARGQVAHNGEPIAAGRDCPDYGLSKFQGGHGGEDTDNYEQIGTQMHPEYLRQLCEDLGIEKNDISDITFDIITIRNRTFGSAPKLSGVIKQVTEAGFHFAQYHCSFCRGPSLPWKTETGAWDVANN